MFDAFMKIKGVKGETQDDDMPDFFEVDSFELGAENNITFGSGTSGGGAGKAMFKDFTISKKTDTASCDLFANLCAGKHFDDGEIQLRRSGGTDAGSGATFLTFKFKMLMLADISWSGSDGDDVCQENLVFQYGSIMMEYYKQGADGKMSKSADAKWSRTKNKADFVV